MVTNFNSLRYKGVTTVLTCVFSEYSKHFLTYLLVSYISSLNSLLITYFPTRLSFLIILHIKLYITGLFSSLQIPSGHKKKYVSTAWEPQLEETQIRNTFTLSLAFSFIWFYCFKPYSHFPTKNNPVLHEFSLTEEIISKF